MWAGEALERFIRTPNIHSVLDVGSGPGHQAAILRAVGRHVTTIDYAPGANFCGDYLDFRASTGGVDGIWCSHCLEHQQNPGLFLQKMFHDLRDEGLLAITVPPRKDEIVGGHVTLWNQGLLVYNLVLAGFDCQHARVSPVYDGYNISVLVRKLARPMDIKLNHDAGDIKALAPYFPWEVFEGFNGLNIAKNWEVGG